MSMAFSMADRDTNRATLPGTVSECPQDGTEHGYPSLSSTHSDKSVMRIFLAPIAFVEGLYYFIILSQ